MSSLEGEGGEEGGGCKALLHDLLLSFFFLWTPEPGLSSLSTVQSEGAGDRTLYRILMNYGRCFCTCYDHSLTTKVEDERPRERSGRRGGEWDHRNDKPLL